MESDVLMFYQNWEPQSSVRIAIFDWAVLVISDMSNGTGKRKLHNRRDLKKTDNKNENFNKMNATRHSLVY